MPMSRVVNVGDLSPDSDWSAALKSVDALLHLAARVHVMKDRPRYPLAEFRRVNVAGAARLAFLFNFMDGIDGIVASEAIFISAAGGAVMWVRGDSPVLVTIALTFSAATLGFLFWNWPPAKIFMGDVGSGFLGFFIAVMALMASETDPAALFIWLILGGAFFADATVTLFRRVARRETLHQAHRAHAYQWLSRRWGSHRPVTLAVLAVNFFWLLPIALLAAWLPRQAIWLAIAALLPLMLLAAVIGAGRPERAT
jgi:Fuc2NAc and GlcNAc transferase